MSDQRRGEHDWGSTLVEAVFLPVEAYHLEDRSCDGTAKLKL